ncbi:MAG TPA: septum formation initiator family protein [Mycobacteriales bacterium]|nr:septum formation initiator family protein [Mycobacteriales bacterium]
MAAPRRTPSGPRRAAARRAGGRAPRPGGRSTRRPEGRRRARQPGRAPARRPPGGLTARAAVLGLVVCALVLSLAYPVKQYVAQRGALAALQRQRVQAQSRVDSLERQRRRLSDPAFVEALARKRLQYVMPGETALVVVTPHPQSQRRRTPAPTHDLDASKPWYSQLWDTVRIADGG